MSRDSIETERLRGAQRAFAPVEAWDEKAKKGFRTAAEQAPFMIRTLGLGSGIAALAAKEGERQELAAILARWLLRDCAYSPCRSPDARPDQTPAWETQLRNASAPLPRGKLEEAVKREWIKRLLAEIAAGNRAQYRAAQIEALGYAGWIKRLAQAFCPKPGSG